METTPANLDLLVRALRFAVQAHRDQRRKSADRPPYIVHPVEVMGLLWETGGVRAPEVLAAALLHDVLEDCGVAPEELRRVFGPAVAGLVREVTDDKTLSRETRRAAQLREVGALSRGARLIRLADKVHNVGSLAEAPPAEWDEARIQEYAEWAAAVVDQIRGICPPLEAEFDRALQAVRRRPRCSSSCGSPPPAGIPPPWP